ncbi:MAG: hypothetical protein ACYTGB_09950, partial [Planctomycetota bacterium]
MPSDAFYANPFFWALMSMLGMAAATSMFSTNRLKENRTFVGAALVIITAGRLFLPTTFCPQPRFEAGPWRWVAGGAILLAALAFGAPGLRVRWWA